tara:strand:- start:34 stop:249 length:216 start_codon:yes stop_codon:yes gene_type:complete
MTITCPICEQPARPYDEALAPFMQKPLGVWACDACNLGFVPMPDIWNGKQGWVAVRSPVLKDESGQIRMEL